MLIKVPCSYFSRRRYDLQIAKYTLLITGLLLTLVGCGKKEKEIPSAFESMDKNKLVRILTDAVNAPFEFGSGTGVQGLDIDMGNEIGKDLGFEVKWVKASGYDHLFELLKNGEAEIIISTIAIDPKKTEDFAFSNPYYDSGDSIARRRDKFDITGLSSLSGKKVGVGAGRPGEVFMTSQQASLGATLTKYTTLDDALGALNRTEIDAVVGDEPILTYSSFMSYQNTTTLPELVNKYEYGVVVRKGEKELLQKINRTIDRLKTSGELTSWSQKWFENVKEDANKRLKEDEEAERLKKAPKSINVNIQKISGAFHMDRLDGFVLVLEGTQGKYQSTPILTDGNRGNCKFSQPVPPGDYRLAMNIFQMVTTVTIPDFSKSSLTMEMRVSSQGIAITVK
jgi:ABC-type amino acid transport substrate-binding protein